MRSEDVFIVKICNKCKQEKELTEFGKNKNTIDGIERYCRQCIRNYHQSSRKNKGIKEDKNITCRICNISVGVKGFPVHLKMHGLEFLPYVKQHFGDFEFFGWKWCDNCRTEPARIFPSSKKKFTTCSRECMYDFRSKEWKEAGHPWQGRKHSDISKKKMSTSQIEQQQQNGHPWQGRKHLKSTKRKLSQNKLLEIKNGTWINPCVHKKYTKPEQQAAEVLTLNGFEFYSQFFLHDATGSFSYDFKIKERPIIIEVDGDYWHGGPGISKHFRYVKSVQKKDILKTNVANQHGYKIIRVWESEMKQNPQILIDRIREHLP